MDPTRGASGLLPDFMKAFPAAEWVGGSSRWKRERNPKPVVLIPGFGGSVLSPVGAGRRDETKRNSWLCASTITDTRGWIERVSVEYRGGGRYAASKGSERLVPYEFGSVAGVIDIVPEIASALSRGPGFDVPRRPSASGQDVPGQVGAGYDDGWPSDDIPLLARLQLALNTASGMSYFGDLVAFARRHGGLCYGAPYDFRIIGDPSVMRSYSLSLKRLIERSVRESGGARAVIVSHSLGSLVTSGALLCPDTSDSWLAENVSDMIDTSPCHGGTLAAMKPMLDGNFYYKLDSETAELLRSVAANNSGLVMGMPDPGLWGESFAVVKRRGGTTLAGDYEGLVGDAWQKTALPILRGRRPPPPAVSHCVIAGRGRATPVAALDDDRYEYLDGDGVVSLASATNPVALGRHSEVIMGTVAHRNAPSSRLVKDKLRQILLQG